MLTPGVVSHCTPSNWLLRDEWPRAEGRYARSSPSRTMHVIQVYTISNVTLTAQAAAYRHLGRSRYSALVSLVSRILQRGRRTIPGPSVDRYCRRCPERWAHNFVLENTSRFQDHVMQFVPLPLNNNKTH